MNARLEPDGSLLIPIRAEGPDGEIGDAFERIGPEHPDYARWREEAILPGETPAQALARRFGVEVAEG